MRFLLLFVLAVLAGCSSVPNSQHPIERIAMSPGYEGWNPGAQKDGLENPRLQALDRAIQNRDWAQARQLLDALAFQPLASQQQHYKAVLEAEVLIGEGRWMEAQAVLPASYAQLSPPMQSRYLLVQARVASRQGRIVDAVEAYSDRHRMLPPNSTGREAWQIELWPFLTAADDATLAAGVRQTQRADVAGWLKLGMLAHQQWDRPEDFVRSLENWRFNQPLHPANQSFLPALMSAADRSYPNSIAVMLPLSGRYASVGTAVRDGFLAAWYQQFENQPMRPNVQFVDTETTELASWMAFDGRAVESIVGPLRKEKVAEMERFMRSSGKQWLPLNQTPSVGTGYQGLALSAEQEAVSVARRMGEEGVRRVVVIAPEGDWGSRVVAAFREAMSNGGGRVVAEQFYPGGQHDYGETIQAALLLNASERRHRNISRAMSKNLSFEPRRRGDVDAVFAPGFANNLRALRPQLRYHRASDVPVYATSHVWSGEENPAADRDLNGVRFVDMPWTLAPSSKDRELKQQLLAAGGDPKRGRFYALGADALRVLPMVSSGSLRFPWVFPGATGRLSPSQSDLLNRELLWAVFKDGRPQLQRRYNGQTASRF